jgi:hypothetical protein
MSAPVRKYRCSYVLPIFSPSPPTTICTDGRSASRPIRFFQIEAVERDATGFGRDPLSPYSPAELRDVEALQ